MEKSVVVSLVLGAIVLLVAFGFYFDSGSDFDYDVSMDDYEDDDVFVESGDVFVDDVEVESDSVESSGYFNIGVEEARDLMDKTNIMVIDVSEDYPDGRIPNSVWYNYFDETLYWAVPLLSVDGSYLVYSHDDESSLIAVEKMVDSGFVSVYRLEGGFQAWEAAGEEIEL